MRPVLLNLDDALTSQTSLEGRVLSDGGRSVDCRDLGPSVRLWGRPASLQALEGRVRAGLDDDARPLLTFMGSGDFHHVSALLVRLASERAPEEAITVIHFDNHPDWVRYQNGLHCGSWVATAARLPSVRKVITMGVCSSDILPPGSKEGDASLIQDGVLELYAHAAPNGGTLDLFGKDFATIQSLGEDGFADFLATRIETDSIYITIDKDVLRPDDAATNWDQGQMTLTYLQRLLGVAAKGRRLVGADVIGDWSHPRYGGAGLAPLLKKGEALLDQPWSTPSVEARRHNEAVNLSLYDTLQALAA